MNTSPLTQVTSQMAEQTSVAAKKDREIFSLKTALAASTEDALTVTPKPKPLIVTP